MYLRIFYFSQRSLGNSRNDDEEMPGKFISLSLFSSLHSPCLFSILIVKYTYTYNIHTTQVWNDVIFIKSFANPIARVSDRLLSRKKCESCAAKLCFVLFDFSIERFYYQFCKKINLSIVKHSALRNQLTSVQIAFAVYK